MPEHVCRSVVVPRESINYISWTIDAYEGVGFLRTDDAASGRVSILTSSDCLDELESLLDAFESEGIKITR
jgi:hypothetical protein